MTEGGCVERSSGETRCGRARRRWEMGRSTFPSSHSLGFTGLARFGDGFGHGDKCLERQRSPFPLLFVFSPKPYWKLDREQIDKLTTRIVSLAPVYVDLVKKSQSRGE